mgnify:CR=1 FL=1
MRGLGAPAMSNAKRAQQLGRVLRLGALRRADRPWWWLLFATSFYLPIQVTFGLLSLVLVPADVATIASYDWCSLT